MSKLLEAYQTTKGTVFKKVEAKDGRIMRFKDGTPVGKQSFEGGKASLKYEGQPIEVAVPSNKGPGYERKEVPNQKAGELGKNLRLLRNDVPGKPQKTFTIDGKEYDIQELGELNKRIQESENAGEVMKNSE